MHWTQAHRTLHFPLGRENTSVRQVESQNHLFLKLDVLFLINVLFSTIYGGLLAHFTV